jgi:hypothetical protein
MQTSQPVLIPHTPYGQPETSHGLVPSWPYVHTIHPSIVKEQIGPLEGRKDKAM